GAQQRVGSRRANPGLQGVGEGQESIHHTGDDLLHGLLLRAAVPGGVHDGFEREGDRPANAGVHLRVRAVRDDLDPDAPLCQPGEQVGQFGGPCAGRGRRRSRGGAL
ncbi:MAG: FIG00525068: membrane protein, partial [uncultured Rubrobacteraceae bacterium]